MVESRDWEGWVKRGEKPLNAPHTMLPLPTAPINKLSNPKHVESDACASIPKALTTIILAAVVNSVKLHLTSCNLFNN